MRGQWLGKYSGSVEGQIMVNVDEVGDHYEAVAYVNPHITGVPASVAYIHTDNKDSHQMVRATLNAVHPETGAQVHWDDIRSLFGDNVSHPKESDVTLQLIDGTLYVESISDIESVLTAKLTKPLAQSDSTLKSTEMTWQEYKDYVSSLKGDYRLFRGQEKPWRLATAFHRRGRYRINEFIRRDVSQLHQRLSAITSHYFDLNFPEQNGAFYNLLQHHGYPTPLLDWTYSPYVAAFFAYRGLPIGYEGEDKVRIFVFDNQAWQNSYPQIRHLDPPFPHLSVMEFVSIDNPRIVPQQGVTTVTNLDDIEAFILEKEVEADAKFLTAIDLPASDRELVMKDLRYMGIAAGSMFPSVDGVCEQFREVNFDN